MRLEWGIWGSFAGSQEGGKEVGGVGGGWVNLGAEEQGEGGREGRKGKR